jgi:hypothetical protein
MPLVNEVKAASRALCTASAVCGAAARSHSSMMALERRDKHAHVLFPGGVHVAANVTAEGSEGHEPTCVCAWCWKRLYSGERRPMLSKRRATLV